jgi:MraZ protein
MLFTGETARSIDEKQRISIPKEMRSAFVMERGESVVYASPGLNDSIWLWPEADFERWANMLEQSVLQEEAETALIRKLFSSTSRLELDKAGRIRLPEKLLAYAGIKGQAMLLGAKNHLEVVDASNWESPQEELMPQQLSELIQRVKNNRKNG